jgi:ABC-type branched-subunit amino acid transport system ATPase component
MLSVENLRASYGRIPILTGVSFHVTEGEFVGILGHNGMGKTTLLKALIGQLPVETGRISLDAAISRICRRRRVRERG